MDVNELVGCFVVEVGVRQAWPFMGFCDNRRTRSREARLYLDAPWSIDRVITDDVNADEQWVCTATQLNSATIDGTWVDADGGLHLATVDGHMLVVSGEPQANTVGEPWWFSDWREI